MMEGTQESLLFVPLEVSYVHVYADDADMDTITAHLALFLACVLLSMLCVQRCRRIDPVPVVVEARPLTPHLPAKGIDP